MNSQKIFYSKPSHVATSKPTDAKIVENWQQEMANGFNDMQSLLDFLQIAPQAPLHEPKKFPVRIPKAFANKMQKGNLNDPLLLQVLPQIQETQAVDGFSVDPLAENSFNQHKGMLHKYKSRVLLTLTGACAVHCRYCFRQHFDYAGNQPNPHSMQQTLSYLNQHPEVNEVIFSGGDPLSLSNKKLQSWFDLLQNAPQIRTIRLHTRLPVVLPNRVDDELLHRLQHSQKNVVIVLHINHPNEIDDALRQKCKALKSLGITLLNQTVLLKGINDNANTLTKLSEKLFDAQILPYYLHVLDKVQGAAHFDLPIEQAVTLYWQLLENLSGYLVPKLVQELPNHPYKTPIDIYRYQTKQSQVQNS